MVVSPSERREKNIVKKCTNTYTDAQFHADLKESSARLDAMAAQALKEHAEGKTRVFQLRDEAYRLLDPERIRDRDIRIAMREDMRRCGRRGRSQGVRVAR